MAFLIASKTLHVFLRVSCIVPCLAILLLLWSEVNPTIVLQASLLAQYIIKRGFPFVASFQVNFLFCDLGLEFIIFLYKVSLTRQRE